MPKSLFVYGSLLTGRCPREIATLLSQTVRQRSPAYIYASLHDLGPYPAARQRNRGTQKVYGEVWQLADLDVTLRQLDAYEDFFPYNIAASEFIRRVTVCFNKHRRPRFCWIYWYRPTISKRKIPHGDYISHLQHYRLLPSRQAVVESALNRIAFDGNHDEKTSIAPPRPKRLESRKSFYWLDRR